MHTTDQRIQRLRERTSQLQTQRDNRIIRVSGLVCVLLCAALITLVGTISGFGPGTVPQMYGTTLLFEGAGGYVLVGVLAFAAAVLITVWGMNSRHKG